MYETGCKLACALCQIVCAAVLRVLLVRRNKQKADVYVDVGVVFWRILRILRYVSHHLGLGLLLIIVESAISTCLLGHSKECSRPWFMSIMH